jgi:hypothetical protein
LRVEAHRVLHVSRRFAELADRLAERGTDFGEFARAEDQHGDHEDDDQMERRETFHAVLLFREPGRERGFDVRPRIGGSVPTAAHEEPREDDDHGDNDRNFECQRAAERDAQDRDGE